ncbi:hypothetical protein MKW94_007754 [Papaver nudicaule]|uniref:Neprosin PEP catalytic domain-containing protein n=1 Tax=Papaver nudicaule TaxID=74823 RepID=A0AA41UXH4_PAPNU|nr:hypothetical protein [Papaver nudicaule]
MFQLRPSSTPEELRSKPLSLSSKVQQPWRNAYLETYACPEGTVLIRRTSKEDLIRAKTFSESFHSSASTFYPNALFVQPYVEHVAWRHLFNKSDISTPPVMHGLQAEIQIDNPVVQENQPSASILLAEGGPANLFSTIMAGWMVSPTLYGDNGTHLSVFWRDGPTNGCFNMLCPGFVQVSSTTPIGGSFHRISGYGGQAYSFIGGIYQDVKSLNWWLTIVANNVSTNIGYFPRETIPYLTNTANYIAWGGLVTTLPNTPSPPMGNGHYPDGDFNKVSVMLNLMYVDDTYTSVKPLDSRLWENGIDGCYDIKYFENYEVGKLIQFGGPGGNC